MARVYVSSTVADLKEERQAVMDWLTTAGHHPVHSYRPDSETVRDSCLRDVEGCDLYVLILGHRYGFQPEQDNRDKLSITHLEFRCALERKMPRVALIRTSVPDIALTDFLNAKRLRLWKTFEAEVRRVMRPYEFHDRAGLITGLSTGVQNELDKLRGAGIDGAQFERTVQTLTDQIAQKDRRISELEEQFRADAVRRTLAAAAQPGATEAVAAARALEAGNTRPAEALLHREENAQAGRIGTEGSDETAQRRQAAALAREQGALALAHDVRAALAGFERAAEYEPDDFWTHLFIGDLHKSLGDLNAARTSYERGASIAADGVASHAAYLESQRNAGAARDRMGDLLLAQGDLAGALDAYRKTLETCIHTGALGARNGQSERDVFVSRIKVADVLNARGELTAALAEYRQALAIQETATAREPESMDAQRDLSAAYGRVGAALLAHGDAADALAASRRSVEIDEALHARNPADWELQRDLFFSYVNIGDVYLDARKMEEAAASYGKAFERAEALTQHDKENTDWQHDLFIAKLKLAKVRFAQGQFGEALKRYEEALATLAALAAREAGNAEWQRELSVTHEEIGDTLARQGDTDSALREYRKGMAIAERLAALDASNALWQSDLAACCLKFGRLKCDANPAAARRQFLLRGRLILTKLADEGRHSYAEKWMPLFDAELRTLNSDEG